ncbi:unnamed protein product [Rotaria sordida]|uniref:Uncharacterized protein n=1 Tax=Rotaria sordida TaxID=392033 RepID=A0A819EG29_9BILA|nr:unnamed protein product [Rotaria sordida]
MSNLKLILEVNQDGKLILPFSRRVLNLPRIENCSQLRNLVTQQGNNFVWLYTGNYDKIRFKTTERELHEVFDRRLLPLNTHSYVGSLILVDYFNYKWSIGSSRELNIHEQSLFKAIANLLTCQTYQVRTTKKISFFYEEIFLIEDNTINNNNAGQRVKSDEAAEASNYSNCSEKRSFAEDINTQTKKMRSETPMLEQKTSMSSAASATAPKFVSAATMAAPITEITDEELLEFTLEFERKHGI